MSGWELTRRELLRVAAAAGVTVGVPRWMAAARALEAGAAARVRGGPPAGVSRDLALRAGPVEIAGGVGAGISVDGTIPGPLIELHEGHDAVLRITNHLDHASSIHWHGILLPFEMDGVPGVAFPGIAPGETFEARFRLRQHGTYWYHSHSDLQEQSGLYGPLVVHPAEPDPHPCERDYVVVLSDWTFEDPHRVADNLKKHSDYYQADPPTLVSLVRDARRSGWDAAVRERLAWSAMRMSATDVADVTGLTYAYLMNGVDPAGNWTAVFSPGQRVRLRFINAGAMTYFNLRIPGLPMTVVAADGPAVRPVTVDEIQIAPAETYDVVVSPEDRAYTIFAETMDRSGYARGSLAPRAGMAAAVPALREPPRRTMADMGMAHATAMSAEHPHRPPDRLDEPGTGLADAGHRVLTYADLQRAGGRSHASRAVDRELELHLTGNMKRYMWSFDGVRFSEVEGPIEFSYGERIRLVLVNDTMMEHPIHLHGMFMELEHGGNEDRPLKHTISIKPAARVSLLVEANEPGRWAFHCHLLYHMKMGMMRVVRVSERTERLA